MKILKRFSVIFYLASFFFPVNPVNSESYFQGFLIFWYGAFFMLANWRFLIWLANVFYILSFLPKVAMGWRRIFFSSLSVVLASLYPVFDDALWAIVLSHQEVSYNKHIGIGYFLWLLSFVITLVDSILRFLQMKKQ